MKLALHLGELPEALAAAITCDKERALASELMGRGEAALVASDGDHVAAYAIFGQDADNMLTVYAARALRGFIAKAAMQGLFGAAQIAGVPVRVHTEKVRAMARMMGADLAVAAKDMDGLPMGVFANGL